MPASSKRIKSSQRKWIWFWLVAWAIPALACNYPTAGRPAAGLSAEALRQTIAAENALPPGATTVAPTDQPDLFPVSPTGTPADSNTSLPPGNPADTLVYETQSGDTLQAVASHFGVAAQDIQSAQPLPAATYFPPGQRLIIPNRLGETRFPGALLPDSEVIAAPGSAGFQVSDYVSQAGGYLSTYQESLDGQVYSGAQIVALVAQEASINPRLLLAFLDYRSHWVRGQPDGSRDERHPLGFYVPGLDGLYQETLLAAKFLTMGYYGWRQGTLTELKFPDQQSVRLSPELNAGSVALQYLFAVLYYPGDMQQALYGQENFAGFYHNMFGDPWARSATSEPLLTPAVAQPTLELPFAAGERWSFSGGPHTAWITGTPPGAIDFSPVTGQPICAVSTAWATAAAPGLVVRSARNALALDLDGDGNEQTGWVLFYYHLADAGRAPVGQQVETGDRLGHPSCEGGNTTGANLHLARKYDGEWLPADGPLPFVLSGWLVQAGARPYQGALIKGDQTVIAQSSGQRSSIIEH